MSKDIANMKDSWFFDNNFNGLSDEIFDDVINFFDFPLEDVEANGVEEDWDAQLKCLEDPRVDVYTASSAGLCAKTQNEKPQLGMKFSASVSILFTVMAFSLTLHGNVVDAATVVVLGNGISPIKQLGKAPGPVYGKTITHQNVTSNGKDLHQFQTYTYSPVSVFESSSSSSVENSNFDRPVIPVKRARSKRQRPSSFSPLFSIPFILNSPAMQNHQRIAAADSDFGTNVAGNLSNKLKKQKKKDSSLLSDDVEMMRSSSPESGSPRKCMHCEVTKTPQWREGPVGPKTLCNACGVRYRSGRLFPEYRPAASPTFVASLHSNCHKKVVEMRSRAIQEPVRGSMLASSNLHGNAVG
ncbi:GATA transcription factor 11 [Glycine soja]|nr:GATA transcription factor 11 [Glycine max]